MHVVINIMLYTRLSMKLLPFTLHLSITSSRLPSGESARTPGGSKTNQTIVRKICVCMEKIPVIIWDNMEIFKFHLRC